MEEPHPEPFDKLSSKLRLILFKLGKALPGHPVREDTLPQPSLRDPGAPRPERRNWGCGLVTLTPGRSHR
jgi:hypothetical protein